MTAAPVNVTAALASFDEIYSPRIVARMNDYDVRVAHAKGEHVWHVHEDTDEFFLVLDGQFDVAIRDANGSQTTVTLRQGDTFVVPKGTEHKPSSPGASILMFEPSGTSSTGDRHEGPIPDHVRQHYRPRARLTRSLTGRGARYRKTTAARQAIGQTPVRGARLRTPRSRRSGPNPGEAFHIGRRAASGPARHHTPAVRRCRRGPEQRRPAGSRRRATPATLAVDPSRDRQPRCPCPYCRPFLKLSVRLARVVLPASPLRRETAEAAADRHRARGRPPTWSPVWSKRT